MISPPPTSTLFPYTTLFRSIRGRHAAQREQCRGGEDLREGAGLERVGERARAGAAVPLARRQRQDFAGRGIDRKSTRLNSSHLGISYAVFCLKKKRNTGSQR